MGQGFLIDTNVVIEYTSNLLPENGSVFVEQIFNTNFITSVIVKIEVLGYNEPTPEKMQLLTEFMDTAKVLPLDDSIMHKTIELRRIKKIKLADAIIAATALVHDLVIVSRNTSDFNNIAGLEVFNPHSL